MGDQGYVVRLIDDEALPAEQNWVLVRCGANYCAFIKESAWCPATVEEAWRAWCEVAAPPSRMTWAV